MCSGFGTLRSVNGGLPDISASDRKRALLWKLLVILLFVDIVLAIAFQPKAPHGLLITSIFQGVTNRDPRIYRFLIFDTPSGFKVVARYTALADKLPSWDEGSPYPEWNRIGKGSTAQLQVSHGILMPAVSRRWMSIHAYRNGGEDFTAAEDTAIRAAFIQAELDDKGSQPYIAEFKQLLASPAGIFEFNPLAILHESLALLTLVTMVYVTPAYLRNRRLRRGNHSLCPNCNYDLSATPHRCPECGHTPSPPQAT
jgi:hypothetical protein